MLRNGIEGWPRNVGNAWCYRRPKPAIKTRFAKSKYTINMIKCNNRVNEVENLFEWMLLSSMLLHKIKFNVIYLKYLMT